MSAIESTPYSKMFLAIVLAVCSTCLETRGAEAALTKTPFFDEELAIRVPATLFEKEVHFLIDTGADVTFLDFKYKERLGQPIESAALNTAVSQSKDAFFYRAPWITIGGTHFQSDSVGCLDLAKLSSILGEPFEGVLGMDAMKKHVVSFDFDRNVMSIGTDVPPQVKERASAIPLKKVGTRERFVLQAYLNDVGPIALKIDTAANLFITLNQNDWEKVFRGRKERSRESIIAGANGEVGKSQMARISEVKIGKHKYTNVIASQSSNPDVSSVIGLGFFRQHVTTFDFPNHVMYLVPGKQFGAAEEVDMSGLRLMKVDSKIIVHSVNEDSPAFAAGFKEGDEILSVNGKAVQSLSLKSIRESLRKKDGSIVTIEATQRGELKKVKLRLKKQI